MTRDELIKACIDAEVWANDGELHSVLDVAEPIIRADERERRDSWAEVVTRADGAARKAVLADLRAKVDALPHAEDCDYGRFTPEGAGDCTCPIADVLALLDGATP